MGDWDARRPLTARSADGPTSLCAGMLIGALRASTLRARMVMMFRRILAARVSCSRAPRLIAIRAPVWGAASLRAPPAELHNYGMFDWNDLRHFLAVAREGSTLAAAKVLRVNQSTVHRHISALEKDLGCKLVERHPTGYRLTDLGKELQVHAERMDESAAALTRHIASSAKGMTGCIRVTCSTAVGHRLMKSGILDRFSGRYPGLRVELIMTERLADLSKGEADIAIRGGEPSDESLVGKKMADVAWGILRHALIHRTLRSTSHARRPEPSSCHPL